MPGAAEAVGALGEIAVESGVRRLVLLSGRGEPEAQAADAEWTILRASWFAQNFSESFMLHQVRAGEVGLPVGAVPEPFVDVEDIADVAAAALTEDGHAGRVYELTGPRALTFAEAVAEIGRAAGRPIRFTSVPLDEYMGSLSAQGVPDEVAGLIAYVFSEVLDGRNAPQDGIRRALGRDARDFRSYARDAAAAGAWAAQPVSAPGA